MILIFIGFPVAFSILGVAVFFGYIRFGDVLVQGQLQSDDVGSRTIWWFHYSSLWDVCSKSQGFSFLRPST